MLIWKINIIVIITAVLIPHVSFQFATKNKFFQKNNHENANEKNYTQIISLLDYAISESPLFKNSSYNRLAYFVDKYGPRLWGSNEEIKSAEELSEQLKNEGFENVRLEPVPDHIHWIRGKENLTMYSPSFQPRNIPVIGLGLSVGGNVKAEVILIKDFNDLDQKKDLIPGKIVFYNFRFTNYSETGQYRYKGAWRAAQYKAVASIIRSVATFSIESPHTGATVYNDLYPKIPVAAISLEDADMIERMVSRGDKIILELNMEAHFDEKVTTYNVIGEYKGSANPNEIVLMGGHWDSWDTGPQTGALDDGAGVIITMEALRLLIKLGLRPRRTIRFIAWSGEEQVQSNNGAWIYAKTHEAEIPDHVLAFETDFGVNKPFGFGFGGTQLGLDFVKNLANYLTPYNMSYIAPDNCETDTEPLQQKGVPVMNILVEDTPNKYFYFTYHHTAGDSMFMLKPQELDQNVFAIASMMFLIADNPQRIPK